MSDSIEERIRNAQTIAELNEAQDELMRQVSEVSDDMLHLVAETTKRTAEHWGEVGTVVKRFGNHAMACRFLLQYAQVEEVDSVQVGIELARLVPFSASRPGFVPEAALLVFRHLRKCVEPFMTINEDTNKEDTAAVIEAVHAIPVFSHVEHHNFAEQAAKHLIYCFRFQSTEALLKFLEQIKCDHAINAAIREWSRDHYLDVPDGMPVREGAMLLHSLSFGNRTGVPIAAEIMNVIVPKIADSGLSLDGLEQLASFVVDPGGEGRDSRPAEDAIIKEARRYRFTGTVHTIQFAASFGTVSGRNRFFLDQIRRNPLLNEEAACLVALLLFDHPGLGAPELIKEIDWQCEQAGWKFRACMQIEKMRCGQADRESHDGRYATTAHGGPIVTLENEITLEDGEDLETMLARMFQGASIVVRVSNHHCLVGGFYC